MNRISEKLCNFATVEKKQNNYDRNYGKNGPDTFTLTVPKADVNFFKTMAKKMGWAIERERTAKPRLYDPETGDYLNDATMRVIENARKGKDVVEVGSMDDYLKLVGNL